MITGERRDQLNSIIQRMKDNNETDDSIQAMVGQFKTKYDRPVKVKKEKARAKLFQPEAKIPYEPVTAPPVTTGVEIKEPELEEYASPYENLMPEIEKAESDYTSTYIEPPEFVQQEIRATTPEKVEQLERQKELREKHPLAAEPVAGALAAFAHNLTTNDLFKELVIRTGHREEGETADQARDRWNNYFVELDEVFSQEHPTASMLGNIGSLIDIIVTADAVNAVNKLSKVGKLGKALKLTQTERRFARGAEIGGVYGAGKGLAEQLPSGQIDISKAIAKGLEDAVLFAFADMGLGKVADAVRGARAGIPTDPLDVKKFKDAVSEARKTLVTNVELSGQDISKVSAETITNILKKSNLKENIKLLDKPKGFAEMAGQKSFMVRDNVRMREVYAPARGGNIVVNEGKVPKNVRGKLKGGAIAFGAPEQAERFADRIANLIKPKREAKRLGARTSEIPTEISTKEIGNISDQLKKKRSALYKMMKPHQIQILKGFMRGAPAESQVQILDDVIKNFDSFKNIKTPKLQFEWFRQRAKDKDIFAITAMPDTDKQKWVQAVFDRDEWVKKMNPRRKQLEKLGQTGTEEYKHLTEQVSSMSLDLAEMENYGATALRTFKELSIDLTVAGKSYGAWRDEVIRAAERFGKTLDDIKKEMKGIDMSDPVARNNFYYKYVGGNLGDLFTEYLYINMLCSPKTHIINSSVNTLQALLPGALKATMATQDAVLKLLGKSQREHFFGEVPIYYWNMFKASGQAIRELGRVVRGKSEFARPDIIKTATAEGVEVLKTGKSLRQLIGEQGWKTGSSYWLKDREVGFVEGVKKSRLWKLYSTDIRLLEAEDAVFNILIRGGEKASIEYALAQRGVAKEVAESFADTEARRRALYWLFRQPLHPRAVTGEAIQGPMLESMDDVTEFILKMRNKPYIGRAIRFMAPFIETPTNILKMGVEFTPFIGHLTAAGAAFPAEQIAKANMGSAISLMAGVLAWQGRLTWAAPRNKKERNLYYQSGLKQFSFITNTHSISYKYLGELGYPLMIAAGLKHHYDEAGRSDQALEMATEMAVPTIMGIIEFFGDLPYAQGFGDVADAIQGDKDALNRFISAPARQMVPLTALVGWTNRIMDRYYRDPQNFAEHFKAQLPELSRSVPRLETDITVGKRKQHIVAERGKFQERFLSATLPTSISRIKPNYMDKYIEAREKRIIEQEKKKLKKKEEHRLLIEQSLIGD